MQVVATQTTVERLLTDRIKHNPLYLSPAVGTVQAAVWDVTSENGLPAGVTPGTVDIVILVFVLSALHPDEWGRAINNIHQVLGAGFICNLITLSISVVLTPDKYFV